MKEFRTELYNTIYYVTVLRHRHTRGRWSCVQLCVFCSLCVSFLGNEINWTELCGLTEIVFVVVFSSLCLHYFFVLKAKYCENIALLQIGKQCRKSTYFKLTFFLTIYIRGKVQHWITKIDDILICFTTRAWTFFFSSVFTRSPHSKFGSAHCKVYYLFSPKMLEKKTHKRT